jgi:hypothetical protein
MFFSYKFFWIFAVIDILNATSRKVMPEYIHYENIKRSPARLIYYIDFICTLRKAGILIDS